MSEGPNLQMYGVKEGRGAGRTRSGGPRTWFSTPARLFHGKLW